MENKKEIERNELHKTIWSIANELRGSVDGWDFKSYVLVTIFYRYISENLINYLRENDNEDYITLSDEKALNGRKSIIQEKGYFILPSELFQNVQKNANINDIDLNEHLANIFKHIQDSAIGTPSQDNLKGLFDDFDVNSAKLGKTVLERNKKLTKVLDAVASMKLGEYQTNSIDAFGDAYEYLMSMYASNAGKSGGEFFTPQEVSELLTRLCIIDKTEINKIYDPTCGSGSLLLKSAQILGKDNVKSFWGQEINQTTYNLCRMNMFLHNIGYENFHIAHGNTLTHPDFQNSEPFDVIVSNPPYSTKWEGEKNIELSNDERFKVAGALPPPSKADLAFVLHSLKWLKESGVAAIVCFPGIFYRGGKEKLIREWLVKNNYIDTIIQLPNNLFFGTSIATCILVLKKNKNNNNSIFMIDASEEFTKATNNNKLSEQNILNIVEIYKNKENIEYKAKNVSFNEIEENDFNLSVNSYISKKEIKEHIDITLLNKEIDEVVKKQEDLRSRISEIIKELEK